MSRFVLTSVAVAVAMVCGLCGSASAQSSWLSGGGIQPAPQVKVNKPVKVAAVKPEVIDEKAAFQTADLVKALPRLGSNFNVISPASKQYNAYAYVIGVTDQWMNVGTGPAEDPLVEMDQHLAQGGFRRSQTFDLTFRRGVQKVVIYGTVKPDGDLDVIQSAVLQMPDGTWSAKIGGMAVIQFGNLNQLVGPTYGRPVAVYERPLAKGNGVVVR